MRDLISSENGALACGNQAQWNGYVRHSSGCLNGNARPLSMAAIRISTVGRVFAVSSVVMGFVI